MRVDRLRRRMPGAFIVVCVALLGGCGQYGKELRAWQDALAERSSAQETKIEALQAKIAAMEGRLKDLAQRDAFDMQERCSRRADQLLRQGIGSQPLTTYESHYNSKLNRCLARIASASNETESAISFLKLIDVNGGVDYGKFLGSTGAPKDGGNAMVCEVAQKSCKDAEEWMALTQALMSD